jgi:hypothetical protein
LDTLQVLIELVKHEGSFTVDLREHPLEIVVLSYEDYVRYSVWIGQNIQRARPDWKFSIDPRMTLANFLPFPDLDRNVVLTYTWDWTTLLHELCHVAIMRQWSADAAVDHNIVYATQGAIMQTDAYLAFLVYATRR